MTKTIHTLHSILLELGTWFTTPEETLMLAQKSGIDTANNEDLYDYVLDWQLGSYDDDIRLLYDRVLDLIPEE